MALLPLYIMRETDKRRLPEHHLGRVLWGRANEAMTTFDYNRLMERTVLLRGDAYAYISRDPASGWPVELIPMDPALVNAFQDRDGSLWYTYVNPRTGEPVKLWPEDVLHYKGPSADGITGVSVLRSAALTIQTALAAQQQQTDLYSNGGQPSGVLTVEADLDGTTKVTDKDGNEKTVSIKDYIRDEWYKNHGPGRAFRIAILDHGLKYQPIGLSNADAQFVESEEIRVADVCRFFGVPLHMAYAGKQAYSSNEQSSLEYVKYTLQPKITDREQEDTYKLLLPSERDEGLRIRREVKAFLRGDTAAQASWYKAMREIGAYSVNDIRSTEDQPNVPGGDTRYANLNNIPLELFQELSVLRNRGQDGGGENTAGGEDNG